MFVSTRWLCGATLLLNSACVTAQPPASWCYSTQTPTNISQHADATFLRVPEREVRGAIERLGSKSAIPLAPGTDSRFLGDRDLTRSRRYYLVRATVYAPAGVGAREAYQRVELSNYQLWFTASGLAVVVSSQAAGPDSVKPHNTALVLSTSAVVNELVVACYYVP